MPPDVALDPAVRPTERLPEPVAPVRLSQLADPADGHPEADAVRTPESDPSATLFRALHDQSPDAADQLAVAVAGLPPAGTDFAGFRLLCELGRGAFGRVFLAEQTELAGRQVVLKVTLDARTEVKVLARLLHTNIVPIYSVHRAGLYQAVCMPYCGSTTLADALRRFRGDTLPESGRGLVTLLQSSARPAGVPGGSAPGLSPAAPEPPAAAASLEVLGALSYVDAVLWLGARLAGGLAHAHQRGILHRDLKPANVLLTDDGQPMLLDFNLAADTALGGLVEAARLGGTLPYMAPEHLESFAGRSRLVDARSDLYALGVILYELLTGAHPFPTYGKAGAETLRRMVADRGRVPRLRDRNPAVSPAVESIVRTCLDPDPARRYPSAQALEEDLERQLTHQPLRHAADPDPRERVRKWARRHPRLSSGFTLGAAALVVVAAAVAAALDQWERRAGLEARETRAAFLAESRQFQLTLAANTDDERGRLARAADRGRRAVGRYPDPSDPDWAAARAVRRLSPADRDDLREEIGVTLLLLAHATAAGADSVAALETAVELTDRAAACFPAGTVPGAVRAQRADLLERLHRADEAAADRRRAEHEPPHGARDLYLAGWDLARRGRFGPAVPWLERATRADPRALSAWYLLGRCHDALGRDAEAIACYGTCLALDPDAPEAWFNRGLAHLRRRDFAQAGADFDRAIELNAASADAHFNRALARKELGDLAGAEADCTRALELGTGYTRVYFVRAQVRDRLGKAAEAASDRRQGLAGEPADESSWTARGFYRLTANPADPTGTLADFDRALARNPRYLPAALNKAHVLGEVLHRPEDAAAVLDQALAHHPDQPSVRAGRAVYLARAGRRAEAHREAEAALAGHADPAVRYQAAGVYALTSKSNPGDRREAFRLLTAALAQGYGFQHLATDPELAPVRPLPEFQELVAAARALRAKR